MNTIHIIENVSRNVLFSYSCENNTVAKTLEYAMANNADLRGANLCNANLRGANLRGADLCNADLCGANLCDANLCDANLCGANLRGANLRGANLCNADLCGANLCDANMRDVNLRGANMRDVNLRDVNLRGANLRMALGLYHACPVEGSFTGWKKASGFIVKLLIPADALRSSAGSTKCRCNKAFVVDIQTVGGGATDVHYVASDYNPMFKYVRGSWVEVKDFDTNRWNECAPGIHFFVDRKEAVEY